MTLEVGLKGRSEWDYTTSKLASLCDLEPSDFCLQVTISIWMSWIRWDSSSLTLQEFQDGWLQGSFSWAIRAGRTLGWFPVCLMTFLSQIRNGGPCCSCPHTSLWGGKQKTTVTLFYRKEDILEALQQSCLYTLLARGVICWLLVLS